MNQNGTNEIVIRVKQIWQRIEILKSRGVDTAQVERRLAILVLKLKRLGGESGKIKH